MAATMRGWGDNHTHSTASWDNTGTSAGYYTVYVSSGPAVSSRGWYDDWLDRLIRACRRERRHRHPWSLRSVAPLTLGSVPRALPKILRWLTRVVRKGA